MTTKIDTEFWEELKEIKPKGSSEATRKIPSDEDIEKIINGIRSAWDLSKFQKVSYEFLIQFLYLSGLRINETYNVLIEDIDLANKSLFVRKGKYSKTRDIALVPNLIKLMEAYLKIRKSVIGASERLFVKQNGEPYSSSHALGKVVIKASWRVGLDYSAHSYRRKCSQYLVHKHGIPIPFAAEHLGHNPQDITTFMTSYCLNPKNAYLESIKNISQEGEGNE